MRRLSWQPPSTWATATRSRPKAPTAAELDTYRAYLAEENERFPYNFSAVWDELAVQFANNG